MGTAGKGKFVGNVYFYFFGRKGCCFYSFDLFEFVTVTLDSERSFILHRTKLNTKHFTEKHILSNDRFIICVIV